jgi:hypothetical protein
LSDLKSLPSASPAPTASTPAQAPKAEWTSAKASPSAVKPSAGNKCPVCSKSVYATEGLNVGHSLYHKGCFRCEEPGCGLALTIKNFKSLEGKIWCEKHVPKAKATAVGVEGNLVLNSQASKS